MIAALLLAAAGPGSAGWIASSPSLGMAEGRCRPNEPGPAILVTAAGLKDRAGLLRVEVYPPGDSDFLADDNVLLMHGRVFRRAEIAVPPRGPVRICVRVPGPGTYTLSLLHDRDSNRRFGISIDGIGFANNPALGFAKPPAAAVRFRAGAGITPISVTLNYRHGLLSFGPLGSP